MAQSPTPRPPRQTIDPSSFEQAVAALQQRLDQIQSNMAQQNKLATLGMVTAVLAHEFNNILTPMISYTKFALSDQKADPALREKALQKALSGAERLANISQSLLGFARGDESTSANIQHAVSETLACLSREPAKDGITLKLEIPAELKVAMNAGQLQQVLMNLIVNARSAMLAASGPSRAGIKRLTITARTIKKDKIAELTIADTGPGIPAEILSRIFDPFFTTKKTSIDIDAATRSADECLPRGGTGLGLTICQELIAGAGGTIRAENSLDRGATFIIELPVG